MGVKVRLGRRIKELRTRFGYTQEHLAELMDISSKTLSWIETGESYPTAKNIDSLAKALKLDVSEILDLRSTKSTKEQKQEINEIVKNISSKEDINVAHKILTSLLR